MKSVSLKRLPLSVRASNVLYRMGLTSVQEFMETPIEEIAVQRNIGEKTLREIEEVRGRIDRGELVFPEEETEPIRRFSESELREMARHSIDELELSNRSHTILKRAQLFQIDKLAALPKAELASLRNLGKKSQQEVLSELEHWLEQNGFREEEESDEGMELTNEEQTYFQRITQVLDPLTHVRWKKLWREARGSGCWADVVRGGWYTINEDNWFTVLRLPFLEPRLAFAMRHMMKNDILDRNEFLERCREIAPHFDPELWFRYGMDEGLLEEHAGFCILKRDRLSEVLAEEEDEPKEMEMVRLKLAGKSLQELGEFYSLSKERVRQLLHREYDSFPPLFEDYFAPILEHFQWTREEFGRLFPELGKVEAEYLFQRYRAGKEPLSQETARGYLGVWKERLMEFLKNEEIRKDQESASRLELILRTLKDHSDVSLTYEELEEAYYDYLKSGGYPMEELELHPRTVINHLRTVPNVVFDREGKVRYCPVRKELIWECIDFEPYKNLVISAERIHRDYPELMVELDIRDGYELFYVIKWSLSARPEDLFDIHCRRVPVIVMGEASEEKQAMKLLRELSPVEYHDYYTAYEEIYGVRRETVQSNPAISSTVAPYFINGVYQLNAVFFEDEEAAQLAEALREKELWWLGELEELFDRICTRSPKEAFNAAAFRRIGYILNSGYLFPAEYVSAVRFFEERYLSDNVIDLSELDSKLLHLPTFHSLLVQKKKELDFVEVSPKLLFSIERIESLYGLTKAHLSELQEWLTRHYLKYFNGYSLWEKVKIHPYVQRLQGNKWMLTCIMRQKEDVISLPVAGSIILSQEKNALRISKICQWILETNGMMTLDELERNFNETFGSRISQDTFAEKLREIHIEPLPQEEDTELSVVSGEGYVDPWNEPKAEDETWREASEEMRTTNGRAEATVTWNEPVDERESWVEWEPTVKSRAASEEEETAEDERALFEEEIDGWSESKDVEERKPWEEWEAPEASMGESEDIWESLAESGGEKAIADEWTPTDEATETFEPFEIRSVVEEITDLRALNEEKPKPRKTRGVDFADWEEEMGKYEPLHEHLARSDRDEIFMSFAEMEEILGVELPPSARRYPAWWSNGGHVQSDSWMNAGYTVNGVDFINGEVRFVSDAPRGRAADEDETTREEEPNPMPNNVVPLRGEMPNGVFDEPSGEVAEDLTETEEETMEETVSETPMRGIPIIVPTELEGKKMTVDGHDFFFIQTLVPERELNGRVKRYYPQDAYENKDELPLLEVGEGPFCRFGVQAGAWSGVYLWVADGEILYIGETVNLANRYNVGYGHISPRNCYAGGLSTNCRMNRVVLDYFEKGKIIALFFCPTADHKALERELLAKRHTKFNVEGEVQGDE